VEPSVIALSLAWRSGDRALDGLTQSERNVLFGVQSTAKTQRDWVVDAASRRLDRLAAYERHRSQPESERGSFDVSTCLKTCASPSRPAPVPGRKRGLSQYYCAWCAQAPIALYVKVASFRPGWCARAVRYSRSRHSCSLHAACV